MQISPEIQTILNRLIQDQIVKAHIYIIEWYDSYNVVFEDGLFISQVCYRMEKENFEKWEKQIIPKGWHFIKKRVYVRVFLFSIINTYLE